jgi:copper chaperone
MYCQESADCGKEPNMTDTTYLVAGTHRGHCASSVTEELAQLDGVSAISVDLAATGESRVRVSSQPPLGESVDRAAIRQAGYELTGVAL